MNSHESHTFLPPLRGWLRLGGSDIPGDLAVSLNAGAKQRE
jgi:hypothetical protein